MATLVNSGITGQVEAVLLHRSQKDDITTEAIDSVAVSFAGFDGESHSGLTRESCVRVKKQYPIGTIIRNTRQICIVSKQELADIAKLMDIAEIDPAWLGANLCISGIPDLTRLPPSTRLLFEGGVSLVVDLENEPCSYPADIIEQHHSGKGKYFVKHAMGKRGVTAWVECEGALGNAEKVAVHVPSQPPYPTLTR